MARPGEKLTEARLHEQLSQVVADLRLRPQLTAWIEEAFWGGKSPEWRERVEEASGRDLQLVPVTELVQRQIHRLKLVKRQMYGRAGFALLRQ